MKELLIIFLVSLIVSIGATAVMYKTEVGDMFAIIKNTLSPPEVALEDMKVASIALDTTGAKLEFAYAEEFTAEGLKVTAIGRDGSTCEVPIDKCKISAPDTTKPGEKKILVTYEKCTAEYTVKVNLRVYPEISSTALVNMASEQTTGPYHVEAEKIDFAISGTQMATGVNSLVANADAETTSGGKYVTGYGVKYNYFGFTFTAAKEYEGVTLVLRVANQGTADLDAGAMKMYLNFSQDENGNASGEIPLQGYIIPANGATGWSEIVINNVTIPAGTNTLTFDVQGTKAFNIDYIDFYVGMPYVRSLIEIDGTQGVVYRNLEELDTDKAFTRSDVANLHGLKDGQLFVEPVTKESSGKSTVGGTSVGAIGTGSQISTHIYLEQKGTIGIWFKAAKEAEYYVADNWNFYVDGVKITGIERTNIQGGDPSQGYYWDWVNTLVGYINLEAGYHSLVIEVQGTDCNVDTVEFEVLSYGSYHALGKDLEEMGISQDGILTVKGTGSYKIEAESLDISGLTPSSGQTAAGIETPTSTTPATSGGQSLGKAGGGSASFTIKLKEKATIQIFGALAFANGGEAADFISATLGDTALTVTGTMPEGTSANRYWNWVECGFGAAMDLEAGEYTFTFTLLKNPNIDYFRVAVYSFGSFTDNTCASICGDCGLCTDDACTHDDHATKCSCVPIAAEFTSGKYSVTIEAETFDNSQVITSPDQVAAGRLQEGTYGTETGNGETCIYGFTTGTKFTLYVSSDANRDVEIILRGAAGNSFDASTNLAITVNGAAVTVPSSELLGSGSTPYWDWKSVSLGRATLKEGVNEIVISITGGAPNMDKIKLVDASTDVTLATSGTTKYELENINCARCDIITRSDFIPAVGAGNCGKGSGRIYGYADGSVFRVYVEVKEAATIQISLAGFGGTALNAQSYKFGNTVITPAEGAVLGSGAVAEGVVGTVTVEAGVYCFEFTSGVSTDLDYVAFTIV